MMSATMRVLALLVFTAPMLIAPVPQVLAPRASAAYTEIGTCVEGGPRPCIASVLRNGAPLDADWHFAAWQDEYGPNQMLRFTARGADGDDLGFDSLADTWEVTLDTGSIVPRIVAGYARDVVVKRGTWPADPSQHFVTVTGHPVTLSGQCDTTNYCPEWADYPNRNENNQWDGTFDVQVYNAEGWLEGERLDSIYGLNSFNNVATSSIPPVIRRDEATGTDYLMVELANRHYYEDGTTVVKGAIELRIPNPFLRLYYGVPDPAAMNSSSLDPSVSGPSAGAGQVNVSQEVGGDAMLVTIDDMTFSRRVAKFKRGVIVPTRPSDVSASRVSSGRGKVSFDRASSRGAKVSGYQVKCLPADGTAASVGSADSSPVYVAGLRGTQSYKCRVRARSKVGPGPWSKTVSLGR